MRIGSLNKYIFIYIAYIYDILADSPPPGSVWPKWEREKPKEFSLKDI